MDSYLRTKVPRLDHPDVVDFFNEQVKKGRNLSLVVSNY